MINKILKWGGLLYFDQATFLVQNFKVWQAIQQQKPEPRRNAAAEDLVAGLGIRDHYFTRFARHAARVKLRNTLAYAPTQNSSFTATAKIVDTEIKRQGHINGQLFVFCLPALDILPRYALLVA